MQFVTNRALVINRLINCLLEFLRLPKDVFFKHQQDFPSGKKVTVECAVNTNFYLVPESEQILTPTPKKWEYLH